MANFFHDDQVRDAQKHLGFSAVQPIRSGGIKSPDSGRTLVEKGQCEGIILTFINLKPCGTGLTVTLQFRAVPYNFPESFPTFYLVSPRSFRLVPDLYKTTKPEPAIQEAGEYRRDDPRNMGWPIDSSFARIHFCQLEELWSRRPLPNRTLVWALTQLGGLLRNPLNVPLFKKAAVGAGEG